MAKDLRNEPKWRKFAKFCHNWYEGSKRWKKQFLPFVKLCQSDSFVCLLLWRRHTQGLCPKAFLPTFDNKQKNKKSSLKLKGNKINRLKCIIIDLLLLRLDTQLCSHLVVEVCIQRAIPGMFIVPHPLQLGTHPLQLGTHPLHVTCLICCENRPIDGATDLLV